MTEHPQKKVVTEHPQQHGENITEHDTQPPGFSQDLSFTPTAEQEQAYREHFQDIQARRWHSEIVTFDPSGDGTHVPELNIHLRETIRNIETGQAVDLRKYYDLDNFKKSIAFFSTNGLAKVKFVIKNGFTKTVPLFDKGDEKEQPQGTFTKALWFLNEGIGNKYGQLGARPVYHAKTSKKGAIWFQHYSDEMFFKGEKIGIANQRRGGEETKPPIGVKKDKFLVTNENVKYFETQPFEGEIAGLFITRALLGSMPCFANYGNFGKNKDASFAVHNFSHDIDLKTQDPMPDGTKPTHEDMWVRIEHMCRTTGHKFAQLNCSPGGFHVHSLIETNQEFADQFEFTVWMQHHYLYIAKLFEAFGIKIDPACKDAARVFRANNMPALARVDGNDHHYLLHFVADIADELDDPELDAVWNCEDRLAWMQDHFSIEEPRKNSTEKKAIDSTVEKVERIGNACGSPQGTLESATNFKEALKKALIEYFPEEGKGARYKYCLDTYFGISHNISHEFAKEVVLPLMVKRGKGNPEKDVENMAKHRQAEGAVPITIGTVLKNLSDLGCDTTELQKLMKRDANLSLMARLKLSYKATKELNVKYLPSDLLTSLESHVKVVGVRSPMGSGKTEILKDLVEHCKRNATKLVSVTYRRTLQESFAKRLGLPTWENYQAEYQKEVEDRDESILLAGGYTTCVDSFQPKMFWRGNTLVIDEAESVIAHCLTATTDIAKHRESTMAALLGAVMQADKVILLDAKLTDATVAMFAQMKGLASDVPNDSIVKICNNWKPEIAPKLHQLNSVRECMDVANDYANHNDKPVLLLTCAQKITSKTAAKVFKAWLIKLGAKPEQVVVFDSENNLLIDSSGYEGIAKLHEKLEGKRYIIGTPSMSTGVDLNGVCSAVIYIAGAAVDTDTDMQFLGRERDFTIPRYIYHLGNACNEAAKLHNELKNLSADAQIFQLRSNEAIALGDGVAACDGDENSINPGRVSSFISEYRAERQLKKYATSTREERIPEFDGDGNPKNYAARCLDDMGWQWIPASPRSAEDVQLDKVFNEELAKLCGELEEKVTAKIAKEELLAAVLGETLWANPELERSIKTIAEAKTIGKEEKEQEIAAQLKGEAISKRVQDALDNYHLQRGYGEGNINRFTVTSYKKGNLAKQRAMRPMWKEIQDFYKEKDRARLGDMKKNGEYWGDVAPQLKSLEIQASMDIRPLELVNGIRDRLADMHTRKPGEAMAMVESFVKEHCDTIAQKLQSEGATERKWKAYLGVSGIDEYSKAKPKKLLRHIANKFGVIEIVGSRKQGIVNASMVSMLFDADVGIMTQMLEHAVREDEAKLEDWRASRLVPC